MFANKIIDESHFLKTAIRWKTVRPVDMVDSESLHFQVPSKDETIFVYYYANYLFIAAIQ